MSSVKVGIRYPESYELRGARSGVRARANDVLFARITPCLENGKLAQLPYDAAPTGGSTEFLVVRPGPDVDPGFLYYWCASPAVRDRAESEMNGTTGRMRFPGNAFSSFPISLPPLEEQRRIVTILEDHLSRLDAADSYLGEAIHRIDTLRAVTLAKLHEGPTVTLASLATNASYGTSTKCVVDGPGPAVVRIPNLVDGTINLSDEKRVADANVDVSNSMLSEGDLLIVRTNGSVQLIGRSAVSPTGLNAAFASYLIRYQLRRDQVRPEWVHAMLSTPQLRLTIEKLAASSAGQHNLSLGKLGPLQIPLPSLTEQERLLDKLSSIDAHRRRLSDAVATSRRRSTALRRSLLDAAFSGRLTSSSNVMSGAQEMIDA
ncbi:restriction endonuclease subunit S [Homoserinimonas sp. OAct 916]|uniref:restriction endonuclease subunit S n=1 Tax=Homoserinimonas sp. OAct 916 TaxID=2211450 RepID=UPI000DBE99E1|nr:restriction endonuclease subunit S [Homoserinimonas sp. OAct 916]